MLFVASGAATAAPTLESIAAIRAKSEWPPLTAQPIAVEGVVTRVDTTRGLFVLQEGSDVVAFDVGRTRLEVRPGQRVSVRAADSWPTLPSTPRYPLYPDRSEALAAFESKPIEQPRFYLARFRGWVHPPVTGEYHFFIASDDASQLLLGSDGSPESCRVVARVLSFTGPREWARMPTQRSEAIHLEAGRAYYIEAVHQQAGGSDHLSVAWEGPGLPQQVIAGAYLTPWTFEPTLARRDRPTGDGSASSRGAILRELWEDETVDDPVMLVIPRRLTASLFLRHPTIVPVAPTGWPKPLPAQVGQPVAPSDHYRWMQVEGVVTFSGRVGERTALEIAEGSKRLEVIVTAPDVKLPAHLRGRRIQVRGVGEALWDGDHQALGRIWVPSGDALSLVREPPDVEFSRVTSIHELRVGEASLPEGTAVKVLGTVVERDGGRFILGDGGTFRAYASADGVHWQPFGPTIEVEMPETALVGFAVNSRSPERYSEAVFTNVTGLPQSLTLADVGEPHRPGRFVQRDGRYVINGIGSDIWNTPDQFTFVHAPMEGDGVVVARVASVHLAAPQSRAGIMFRESLATEAPFVQLVQSAAGGPLATSVQWRSVAVGRSQHAVEAPMVNDLPPQWLKLERRTNRVIVQSDTELDLAIGDRVEVAGYFANEAGEPMLMDARVQGVPNPGDNGDAAADGPWRPTVDIATVLDSGRKWGGYDFFRLRGVVTFCGEVAGRRYWTMQDASGAVVFQARGPSKLFHVDPGTFVELYSNPGWFPPTNALFVDNVFRMGAAAFPKPILHPAQYLLPRRGEGTWIELDGVVRGALGDGLLAVKSRGELFTVAVSGVPRSQLEALVDGEIRVRGAIVFPNERDRMVLAPSLEQVEVLQTPVADPFARPIESPRDLAANPLVNQSRHRTRISGAVTLATGTLVFVQDESGGAQVELEGSTSVAVGTAVEVVGFPDPGDQGGVVLRHALIRDLGRRMPVEPRPLAGASAGEAFELVRIQAAVTQGQGDWLELEANGQLWRAARPANGDAFPALPPGSILDLVGIQVSPTAQYPWVRPAERSSLQAAPQLLLRTGADILVLSTPKWWAVRRTLMATGVFVLIVGAGLVWIQILRRRVRQRSAELAATMKKLEDEARISATLAERDRLAGEIHDTVEQGLNGLVLQLDTTADLTACPPDVRSGLRLARNMAAFSRAEVKHAIWELQSPLLENSDLTQAVQTVVSQLVPETLRTRVTIKGEPRRLGSMTEHHVLRLVQEAVNNAVKHARAETLVVELEFDADALMIVVQDDGCGFDPSNRRLALLGHFGLSSMRNRAHKIFGELDILSAPGQGTQVRIRVPAVQPQSSE